MPNRREFLLKTAATIGASAAVSSCVAGSATPSHDEHEQQRPTNCPDVKTPMKNVEGKVAFITGGSSGIGLGIAKACIDAGMKVAVTYRTKGHIEAAMKYFEGAQDRVHAISVDVTDRPSMERAARETVEVFGKVHLLVNNAGVAVEAPLSRSTYDDWDWVMSVNVTGVFNGVHAFLPHIQAHGEGGHIVTTAGSLGLYTMNAFGAYSASKFAVVGMMETLRAELLDTIIGVSVYCPGSGIRPGQTGNADPFVAGRLVLRGVRNNDLYILTHPEVNEVIRERAAAILAAMPADAQTADGRTAMQSVANSSPMYAQERDHARCLVTSS